MRWNLREEENYYFRLAVHRDWLLALIDARPEIVSPAFRRAELRNAAEKLAGDLCISRPKSRLSWGIRAAVRSQFRHVCLVRRADQLHLLRRLRSGRGQRIAGVFAALAGDRAYHREGHHGAGARRYWPIMLHALGFADAAISPLLVHGFWNLGGAKMSKSLGNSADPAALAERYGAETLRLYLMSEIATGKDADFSEERLVMRSNEDLAKNLGNLLNRTLNMAAKYRGGRLAKFQHPGETRLDAVVENYVAIYRDRFEGFATTLEGTRWPADPYQVHAALGAVFDLASHCNQFIENEKPWALAKDPELATRLDAVLYHLSDSLRILAILLSPILPGAARGIARQLNWDRPFALADARWGGLPDGHELGAGTPLFPRLEASTPMPAE